VKALVTGSSGFVGRHMVKTLETAGYWVTKIDLVTHNDVRKYIPTCITRFDLVVHAAAAAPHRKAIDTERVNFPYNVGLDATMFEWAIRTKQRRFVYLSSSAAYPKMFQGPHRSERLREAYINPTSPEEPDSVYGWTKLLGERMAEAAHADGLNVHIVRPFSGYGEDQSTDFPFRAFAQRAKTKADPFIIWGSAEQVRDWIHIDDICRAIMMLIDDDFALPVNLCTGTGTSMYQLATLMCEHIGYVPQVRVDHDAPLGVFYRVGDPIRMFDHYIPKISIEEGIRRALR
jgi:nucleoside-diphosphate-sugar epimerase